MKECNKSSKIMSLTIFVSSLEEAMRMRANGEKFTFEYGNPAEFGLQLQDEVIHDLIMNAR